MTVRINVLVADDHPLVRSGILATLAEEEDIEVVGEAASAEAACERCHTLRRPRGTSTGRGRGREARGGEPLQEALTMTRPTFIKTKLYIDKPSTP